MNPGSHQAYNDDIHACLTLGRSWLAEGNHIQLLTVYEGRIRRMVDKNEKQLDGLQQIRKQAYAEALREELLIAKLALMKGETYEPPQPDPLPEIPELAPTEAVAGSPETTENKVPKPPTIRRNGFVFSIVELHRLIARALRHEEATHYENSNWHRQTAWDKPGIALPQAA